jgi:hypothetical protein
VRGRGEPVRPGADNGNVGISHGLPAAAAVRAYGGGVRAAQACADLAEMHVLPI